MNDKPWAGRFKQKTNKKFEKFSESISFDKKLAIYDIKSSSAHINILAKQKIIPKKTALKINLGLKQIQKEILSGKFKFNPQLEDIHMNIEARLFQIVGDIAGKLHIARSRNDLVLNDLKLWLKNELEQIDLKIRSLIKTLILKAEKNISIIMPGYTHTRPAQPILFSHWLLAFTEMLIRDQKRFADCYQRTDLCPLGSGALAGTNYNIDRKSLAKNLGFSRITENSIDAVSDRDFLLDFLSASAILMMHLSRLSEELIWRTDEQIRFFDLPESLCTGSSIMPNKKNPDALELIRGKTGRVYGHLFSLLTIMKATPLAYNRDFQEDKEPVFDTAETVKNCLDIMELLIKGLKPNPKKMKEACQKGFILATDLADYLVQKGMGFRQAHLAVGNLVRYCEANQKNFQDLSLAEFKKASNLFANDVYKILSPVASVKSKSTPGGTSPEQVKKQIKRLKNLIK